MTQRGQFRFAPLQGEFAAGLLAGYGVRPELLDTFYLVAHYGTPDQRLLRKGRGGLFLCRELGWPWRALSVLGILPTFLLDFGYDLIARNRYRMFGKYDSCPVPEPEHRARFVEMGST